jgi:hypothetical protein
MTQRLSSPISFSYDFNSRLIPFKNEEQLKRKKRNGVHCHAAKLGI